jgi:hypothetical protein
MPVEPVDPSKKTSGDGSEKYTPPKEKFGLSDYDKAAEKVKQENEKAKADAQKMAEEHRAKVKAESPRTYAERLQDMGRLPKPTGGGGGSGGMGGNKLSNRDLTRAYKTGGKVSFVSKRADGCCVKGKTKGKVL